jgi:hypothetical protein
MIPTRTQAGYERSAISYKLSDSFTINQATESPGKTRIVNPVIARRQAAYSTQSATSPLANATIRGNDVNDVKYKYHFSFPDEGLVGNISIGITLQELW